LTTYLHKYTVLFTPTFKLVQQLLAAKRDLRLEQSLRKLDRYDVVVLDDLGYVKQEREEMEVLFTLLAERYERGSVLLTSNLAFSQWEQIFKDAMTTALFSLDYEHDHLNTPRIAAVVDKETRTGALGIVRHDAILIRVFELQAGEAFYLATYEHNYPDTSFIDNNSPIRTPDSNKNCYHSPFHHFSCRIYQKLYIVFCEQIFR
jgi:hypothetical protein